MGYVKPSGSDVLKLPSDPSYWVRMKERAGFGDTAKAENAMIKVAPSAGTNGSNGKPPEMFLPDGSPNFAVLDDMQLDAYVIALLSRMIIEWNLTDEQDKPLPISAQTIAILEPEDGDFLATEAQRRIRRRPQDKRVPFVKRSGQRSKVIASPTPRLPAS